MVKEAYRGLQIFQFHFPMCLCDGKVKDFKGQSVLGKRLLNGLFAMILFYVSPVHKGGISKILNLDFHPC